MLLELVYTIGAEDWGKADNRAEQLLEQLRARLEPAGRLGRTAGAPRLEGARVTHVT